MKTKLAVGISVFLLGILVYSGDIKTLDGQVYKNATIVDSNPTGIDIEFKNANGYTVVKGLKFNNLPADIGKRYGYDPKQYAKYEKQIAKYKHQKMEKVISNQKKQIIKMKKELKGKQGDFSVNLKHPDNEELIFSRRSSVKLKVVGVTTAGALARVEKKYSGPAITDGNIMVEGLHLPDASVWTGFIYPLGMKARYRKTKDIPLYTSNLSEGLKLLNDHLNMYGDYSANAADDDDSNQDDINYDDYYGGQPSYYVDDQRPVYWYHNHHWHRHHWHHQHWHHNHPYKPHPYTHSHPHPHPHQYFHPQHPHTPVYHGGAHHFGGFHSGGFHGGSHGGSHGAGAPHGRR